ncbi:universal stress protein [Kitasatospora purpeofusca]|uniref:universal stress protein n=1 Tax=Kitasatospora purpeofusca TaxID=67352 RepID=UPI00225419DA|nr:universal stress protein [Kitasatospora purpeofusca]MCX4755746.1 universal stress protein [Kitasatospora purpeofusca]WSR36393.1 universal stress protein [Kitasatospora purpeofusca]WSR44678.1 universal stress protein [Kitasatospora purpeofusca]
MNGPVVVGFDGSPESLAATDWAAREAQRRGLPLELLQAWPWPKTDVLGTDEAISWSRQRLAAREAELRAALTGTDVTSAHVPKDPVEALEAAGRSATLLVLGSRGLGIVRGFLVGSVSHQLLRRAACPVVLVRADTPPSPGGAAGDIVVGVDLNHPCDDLLAFAFEVAGLRAAPLRIVHGWEPPVGSEYLSPTAADGTARDLSAVDRDRLDALLADWRSRCPDVDAAARLVKASPAAALVDASETADLVVVGRHVRHRPLGTHLGPVAHAAVHHIGCPVAVVPHE